jgi:NADPH:quinone reductase-like Zn-dependent oxidoreductase
VARTIRFHETGAPNVLRFEDIPVGDPGAGEVRIAVDAIGLNRGEAAFRAGEYLVAPVLPSRLGSEGVGRVLAVGPGVEDLQQGQRVCILPTFPQGQFGVYAAETIVPRHSLIDVPQSWDDVRAASVWVAFLTAWGGLIEEARLTSGDVVVITAAASNVGMAAIQIARSVGAIPVAIVRSGAKVDAVKAAGAASVVLPSDDLRSAIRDAAGGQGVRVVFDAVGGPFAETLMDVMTERALMIVYGGLSGLPTPFPRRQAMRKNIAMLGYNFFELLRDRARRAAACAAIVEGLNSGRWVAQVNRVFAFDEMIAAHDYLEKSLGVGKIVVTIARE